MYDPRKLFNDVLPKCYISSGVEKDRFELITSWNSTALRTFYTLERDENEIVFSLSVRKRIHASTSRKIGSLGGSARAPLCSRPHPITTERAKACSIMFWVILGTVLTH